MGLGGTLYYHYSFKLKFKLMPIKYCVRLF